MALFLLLAKQPHVAVCTTSCMSTVVGVFHSRVSNSQKATGLNPSYLCMCHEWVTHSTCSKGTAPWLTCAHTANKSFSLSKISAEILLSWICICSVRSTQTCANTTTAWPVAWRLPSMPSCVIGPLQMVTRWMRPFRRAWTTLGTPSSRPLAWWQETRSLTRSDIIVPFQAHTWKLLTVVVKEGVLAHLHVCPAASRATSWSLQWQEQH